MRPRYARALAGLVGVPVLLEIQAKVEHRLRQSTFGAHKQGDEQAPGPAVAVEEMDGMVSNCTWASAALTRSGVFTGSS